MKKEAIKDFVDTLLNDKTVSLTDREGLEEVLENSSKQLEGEGLYEFLQSVKETINTSEKSIFDKNGIDLDSFKNITENIVIEVKKEIIKKENLKREEADEKNNSKSALLEVIENYRKQLIDEENIKEFIECIQIIRESNPGLSIMGCIAKTEGMLKAKKNLENVLSKYSEDEIQNDFWGVVNSEITDPVEQQINKVNTVDILFDNYETRSYSGGPIAEELLQAALEEDITTDSYGRIWVEYDNRFVFNFDDTQKDYGKKKYAIEISPELYSDYRDYRGYGYEKTSSEKKREALHQALSNKEKRNQLRAAKKANELIKGRDKALEIIAIHEQAIEERLLKEDDPEVCKTPNAMIELIRAKRKEKELREEFAENSSKLGKNFLCTDESIYKSNTLLTDENKRKQIIQLYFEKGLSAVEIYKQLVETGEIEKGSHLIADDVIDVVVEEASKCLPEVEYKKLRDREREIEELDAKQQAYGQIMGNAYARQKTYCAEMAGSIRGKYKRKKIDLIQEGKETREKVSSYLLKKKNETRESIMEDRQDERTESKDGRNDTIRIEQFLNFANQTPVDMSDLQREYEEIIVAKENSRERKVNSNEQQIPVKKPKTIEEK